MGREAWVEIPSEADMGWTPETGQGYDFNFLPAMGRLIMAHPGIGPAFIQLLAAVMFGPGAHSRREREMVAGVSAAAQDCFY